MENQRPNINQIRRKPPKRLSMWHIFIPIAINYLITLGIEFCYMMGITIRVMVNYIRNTPELTKLMSNADLSYSEMMNKVNGFFTDDVTEWVMDQVLTEFIDSMAFLTAFSAAVGIPVFIWMYRKDKKQFLNGKVTKRKPEAWWKYSFIFVGSICVCIALNNLINLSQLSRLSRSYKEASETLYSVSFLAQLICWGFLTPIVEELIFRGVIYNRLKMMVKPLGAMGWSALIFAAYHGNVVQGVYTGICGLMLVWIYERYNSIKAPILAHVVLNITSIIMTQYNVFLWLFKEPLRMGIITVVSATLAATIYVVIQNHTKPYLKFKNPVDHIL